MHELQKKSDDELDALSRIELYNSYGVDRRELESAYRTLVARAEPLTLEEGERIGLETAIAIASARELVRSAKVTVPKKRSGAIIGEMMAGLARPRP